MTRIFICEEWSPEKNYWSTAFITNDQETADKWRRLGVRGKERKFSDHICYNHEEITAKGLLDRPEGQNQEN